MKSNSWNEQNFPGLNEHAFKNSVDKTKTVGYNVKSTYVSNFSIDFEYKKIPLPHKKMFRIWKQSLGTLAS